MGTKTIEDEIKDLIYRFSTNNNLNCDVKDLTHLKTYTIDDSKTVEIDDAISLEKVSGQEKLWIHIASPASADQQLLARSPSAAQEMLWKILIARTLMSMFLL